LGNFATVLMQSDSDWSEVSDTQHSPWEILPTPVASNNPQTHPNGVDHDEISSVRSSEHSEEWTNLPAQAEEAKTTNSNSKCHSSVPQSIDENTAVAASDAPLPMATLHNVDIKEELARQEEEIERLRLELQLAQLERDDALQTIDELKEERNREHLQVARLLDVNGRIARQNIVLRNMVSKKKRALDQAQNKNNHAKRQSKTYQRPTVPAKLRFRRARTTHRSVFIRERGW